MKRRRDNNERFEDRGRCNGRGNDEGEINEGVKEIGRTQWKRQI